MLALPCLDDIDNCCDDYVIGLAGDVVRICRVEGVAALNRGTSLPAPGPLRMTPSVSAAVRPISAPAMAFGLEIITGHDPAKKKGPPVRLQSAPEQRPRVGSRLGSGHPHRRLPTARMDH